MDHADQDHVQLVDMLGGVCSVRPQAVICRLLTICLLLDFTVEAQVSTVLLDRQAVAEPTTSSSCLHRVLTASIGSQFLLLESLASLTNSMNSLSNSTSTEFCQKPWVVISTSSPSMPRLISLRIWLREISILLLLIQAHMLVSV